MIWLKRCSSKFWECLLSKLTGPSRIQNVWLDLRWEKWQDADKVTHNEGGNLGRGWLMNSLGTLMCRLSVSPLLHRPSSTDPGVVGFYTFQIHGLELDSNFCQKFLQIWVEQLQSDWIWEEIGFYCRIVQLFVVPFIRSKTLLMHNRVNCSSDCPIFFCHWTTCI